MNLPARLLYKVLRGCTALKNSTKVQNLKKLFYYIFSLKNLYIFI